MFGPPFQYCRTGLTQALEMIFVMFLSGFLISTAQDMVSKAYKVGRRERVV